MDRNPALPIAAAEDTTSVLHDLRTGRRYQDLELVFDDDTIGGFRQGYYCLNCFEKQERPFPMECGVCGFPMKLEQSQRFAEQFAPSATFGPSRSLEETLAADDEAREKARRDQARS